MRVRRRLNRLPGRWAIDIVGHRGARALHPENTLAGFQAALAAGTRQFEADAGMTRDGVVVLCHDPFLPGDIARTPDGAWLGSRRVLLHGIDHDHLQAFDVGRLRPGSRGGRRFPRQVHRRRPDLAYAWLTARSTRAWRGCCGR